MAKQKEGYVWYWGERKSWYARITYTDASGKRRNICRSVDNKTEGYQLLKKLKRELEDHGEKRIDAEKMTFCQLAETYSARKLVPAEYQGETKVRGLRSYKHLLIYLKTLIKHFGGLRIQRITYSDLEDFRAKRLLTKTNRNADRSAAAVNRELSLMRTILNHAKREGWISKNPFDAGDPLIKPADEVKRERVLSFEEEDRLLLACATPREHLRPMIICALDTGLRKSEMLRLCWSDVDFDAGLIRARATTTKTRKPRTVGMTPRLRIELEQLRKLATNAVGRIFNQNDLKRSFGTACRIAGIENLKWHDLRHSATTRMVEGGVAPMIAMKITGHTQMQTFARYVNADDNAAARAAEVLASLRGNEKDATASEFVN